MSAKIESIANKVLAKRTKKSARIETMKEDLARLVLEKDMTYREVAEVFSELIGEPVSENYLYQRIRGTVAAMKKEKESSGG